MRRDAVFRVFHVGDRSGVVGRSTLDRRVRISPALSYPGVVSKGRSTRSAARSSSVLASCSRSEPPTVTSAERSSPCSRSPIPRWRCRSGRILWCSRPLGFPWRRARGRAKAARFIGALAGASHSHWHHPGRAFVCARPPACRRAQHLLVADPGRLRMDLAGGASPGRWRHSSDWKTTPPGMTGSYPRSSTRGPVGVAPCFARSRSIVRAQPHLRCGPANAPRGRRSDDLDVPESRCRTLTSFGRDRGRYFDRALNHPLSSSSEVHCRPVDGGIALMSADDEIVGQRGSGDQHPTTVERFHRWVLRCGLTPVLVLRASSLEGR